MQTSSCWTNFSPVGTPLVAAIGVAGYRRLMAHIEWCYHCSSQSTIPMHLVYTQSTNHIAPAFLICARQALLFKVLDKFSQRLGAFLPEVSGKVTSPQTEPPNSGGLFLSHSPGLGNTKMRETWQPILFITGFCIDLIGTYIYIDRNIHSTYI